MSSGQGATTIRRARSARARPGGPPPCMDRPPPTNMSSWQQEEGWHARMAALLGLTVSEWQNRLNQVDGSFHVDPSVYEHAAGCCCFDTESGDEPLDSDDSESNDPFELPDGYAHALQEQQEYDGADVH